MNLEMEVVSEWVKINKKSRHHHYPAASTQSWIQYDARVKHASNCIENSFLSLVSENTRKCGHTVIEFNRARCSLRRMVKRTVCAVGSLKMTREMSFRVPAWPDLTLVSVAICHLLLTISRQHMRISRSNLQPDHKTLFPPRIHPPIISVYPERLLEIVLVIFLYSNYPSGMYTSREFVFTNSFL